MGGRFALAAGSESGEASTAQQRHPGHRPVECAASSSLRASHSSAGIFLARRAHTNKRLNVQLVLYSRRHRLSSCAYFIDCSTQIRSACPRVTVYTKLTPTRFRERCQTIGRLFSFSAMLIFRALRRFRGTISKVAQGRPTFGRGEASGGRPTGPGPSGRPNETTNEPAHSCVATLCARFI